MRCDGRWRRSRSARKQRQSAVVPLAQAAAWVAPPARRGRQRLAPERQRAAVWAAGPSVWVVRRAHVVSSPHSAGLQAVRALGTVNAVDHGLRVLRLWLVDGRNADLGALATVAQLAAEDGGGGWVWTGWLPLHLQGGAHQAGSTVDLCLKQALQHGAAGGGRGVDQPQILDGLGACRRQRVGQPSSPSAGLQSRGWRRGSRAGQQAPAVASPTCTALRGARPSPTTHRRRQRPVRHQTGGWVRPCKWCRSSCTATTTPPRLCTCTAVAAGPGWLSKVRRAGRTAARRRSCAGSNTSGQQPPRCTHLRQSKATASSALPYQSPRRTAPPPSPSWRHATRAASVPSPVISSTAATAHLPSGPNNSSLPSWALKPSARRTLRTLCAPAQVGAARRASQLQAARAEQAAAHQAGSRPPAQAMVPK